nr:hypothetical protein [Tanacetum cinerariifolium]
MIELESLQAKESFMQHVGVASWFSHLRNAQMDFVSRDRIVSVDLEGVPLHAWTRATFIRIGSKWEEVLELEEGTDDMFARKRLYIKTNQEDTIFENFKIIIKGKVFVIRAKELFVWAPIFKGVMKVDYNTDVESTKGSGVNQGDAYNKHNVDDESNGEAVSETCFGDNGDDLNHDSPAVDNDLSPDPFGVYDLLHKQNERKNNDDQFMDLSSRMFEKVQRDKEHKSSDVHNTKVSLNNGGSILNALDDMIKVGQIMGYDMDGCVKDMERIIGSQGVNGVLQ